MNLRAILRRTEPSDWLMTAGFALLVLVVVGTVAVVLAIDPEPVSDPCSWDPEVHVQHVWMSELNAWACVPADQAG